MASDQSHFFSSVEIGMPAMLSSLFGHPSLRVGLTKGEERLSILDAALDSSSILTFQRFNVLSKISILYLTSYSVTVIKAFDRTT